MLLRVVMGDVADVTEAYAASVFKFKCAGEFGGLYSVSFWRKNWNLIWTPIPASAPIPPLLIKTATQKPTHFNPETEIACTSETSAI